MTISGDIAVVEQTVDDAKAYSLVLQSLRVPVVVETVARTIDGVVKLHELNGGREPVLRPGPPCRWCPALPTCDTGRRHLGDDPDADDRWDDDVLDP